MRMFLTDSIIRELDSSNKRMVVSDEGCQNLVLVVQPSGIKTWQWRGRLHGQKTQHLLGNYPVHSIPAARKWSNRITAARHKDIDLITKRQAKSSQVGEDRNKTCDCLWSVYFEGGTRKLKTSTLKEKIRVYDRDINPHIGKRRVDSITYYDLAKIVRDKYSVAPVGSNGMVAILKRWFHWSVTHGRPMTRLESDPARDLVKHEEPRSRKRFLNDYEIGLLFKVMSRTKSIMCEPITLVLYTGVRRAEAFEAQWSEFEATEKGEWSIPGERTKNGLDHLIPLPVVMQAMVAEIRARPNARVLVWPTTACMDEEVERPMTGYSNFMDRLNEQMQALAAKDGKILLRFTIHDLRRTMSTGMRGLLDADDRPLIDRNIVERCMNHTIPGVAAVYDRLDYLREKRLPFVCGQNI